MGQNEMKVDTPPLAGLPLPTSQSSVLGSTELAEVSPQSFFRDAGAGVFIFAVLLFAYLNVVRIPYAFMDDYFWLNLSLRSPADVVGFLGAQGRPLNAVILRAAFQMAGRVANLRWVRLATIVESAAMGWAFYFAVRRGGWKRFPAAVLATLACLTPSVQVYIAWATSVPLPWSGLLAIMAALVTWRAIDRGSRPWVGYGGAAILLAISAIIYQPTVMMFWPVAALDLFRREREKDRLKRFAIYLAVAAAGLFLGWLAFKWGLVEFKHWVKDERSGLTRHPWQKVKWFVGQPLTEILNPFRIWGRPSIAIGVGAFLIVGLVVLLGGSFLQRMVGVLLAAAMIPLSYLPNLVAVENWSSYRTQIGPALLVLVLLGVTVNGLWRMIARHPLPVPVLLAAIFFAAVLAGYNVTVFFAEPQMIELTEFRQALSRPEVRAAKQIEFLQPSWVERLTPFSKYDEFGRNSLHAGWVPQSAINLIRREFDPDAGRIPVQIYPDFRGAWTTPLPPGDVLLDFRDLRNVH
ncbi:MAG TPA: glucosyltransferase domain-containing protein [Tepidisphaeraceae bacterium]|nr:glucosyltransferase domain-containing protein [Tepidisphaeraceae bacterium]